MIYSSLSSGVKSVCDVRINLVIVNAVQVVTQGVGKSEGVVIQYKYTLCRRGRVQVL